MDYYARRRQADADGPKPGWGDYQKRFEELGEDAAMLMSDDEGVEIGAEKTAKRKDTMAWLTVRE